MSTAQTDHPDLHQSPTQSPDEDALDLATASSQALDSFRRYAGQRPDVVALWAFGIGFVLGWKLKPW